jgi:Tfp pilus assembly protein PilN
MNSPNQLSFLPDDYLARKARRRTNVICAGLFLICAVAIVAAIVITERGLDEARKRNAEVTARYSEAARPIRQFQQLQEKQRTMAHQAELTASLLERVPRSFLLAELTNAMPAGVSLFDFTLDSRIRSTPAPVPQTAFDKKKAELSSAQAQTQQLAQPRLYDVTLKLTGVAPTDVQVAQFISKLNGSKLVRDVNLLVSDEYIQEKEKLRKFQIEMTIDPAAEVTATEPEKKTASVELGVVIESK